MGINQITNNGVIIMLQIFFSILGIIGFISCGIAFSNLQKYDKKK